MPIKVISPYGHQLKTDVNELDADVREIMGVKDDDGYDTPTVYILNDNVEAKKVRGNIVHKKIDDNSSSFYSPKGKAIYISNEEYQELGDKLIRHELSHHYDMIRNRERISSEEMERRTREAEFGYSPEFKKVKSIFRNIFNVFRD